MKISIAYMRDLEREVALEKITFSRMVELLNEKANEPNSSEPIVSSRVYEPKYVLKLIESYFGPGAAKGCAERLRQIQVEGWTPEHDDLSTDGSLSLASAMYIMSEEQRLEELSKTNDPMVPPTGWPWLVEYWNPTPDNRIRELEKGIALGMAEIDRLERKEEQK
jgi:hypothetical protein